MTHALYDKYLSEHGAIEVRDEAVSRIKRRYWKACLKSISPWLEERRKAVVSVFSKQLNAIAAANNGKIPRYVNTDKVGNKRYVFVDQADIEYNNIVGMVKFGEITSTTVDEQCAESICRYTKAVRDEIAHLRAPLPGDVSDLIREMDRLLLNKSN